MINHNQHPLSSLLFIVATAVVGYVGHAFWAEANEILGVVLQVLSLFMAIMYIITHWARFAFWVRKLFRLS